MPVDERTRRQFERWGKNPPESIEHGVTADDIRANLKELKPNSWRLEGNKLIGETDMGPLVQLIPTDRILTGTDKSGLPVFKKL